MKTTIYERNYKALSAILGDLSSLPESAQMKSGGFMDLNMDLLSQTGDQVVIAISHYYKHPSGDMIPDPDMELRINLKDQYVVSLAYQDSFGHQRVYWTDEIGQAMYSPREKKSQNSFLSMWLRNLKNQGFKLEAEKQEVLCP